jgi:hypothetical protein
MGLEIDKKHFVPINRHVVATLRRAIASFRLITLSLAAATLVLFSSGFLARGGERREQSAVSATPPAPTRVGPLARSVRDPSAAPRRKGVDAREVWRRVLALDALRGPAVCMFDNGLPLEDFGDPASQLSESPDELWQFIAGAADDFMLVEGAPVDPHCRITLVRAAFKFFNDGAEGATPTTTWDSVFVTIYEDVAGSPAGEPDEFGGQAPGSLFVASQEVPAAALMNETLVGADCAPCYHIEIPVDILVRKNQKYWLSIVPRFIAPPQSSWCYSQVDAADDPGKQGFPALAVPFWDDVPGNFEDRGCTNPPTQFSRNDLAFVLFGSGEADVLGACCDDANPPCIEGVSIVDCQRPTQRFRPGGVCGDFVPACGDQTPGACCLPSGTCADMQTPAQCEQMGGTYGAGDCQVVACPPANEECADAVPLTGPDVSVEFDTTLAATGAVAPATNCGPMRQDIWIAYQVPCDGTVTLHTIGSSFDTALAVYGPGMASCPDVALCPAADLSELACNDDFEMNPYSYLSVPALSGQCLLIRVGGKDLGEGASGGPGTLTIACIEPGNGACCHADGACEILADAACIAAGDVFTAGQPCSTATCVEPVVECCRGDANDDCLIDELDIEPFAAALLDPPAPGTIAYCRIDANEDNVVDARDIAPLIAKMLATESCVLACCGGDTNNDLFLNGLDLQGLIDAILNPPACGTSAFCRADVNEDLVIDPSDVDALVQKLLAGESCPIP